MKLFITGGCGQIGSHVAELLLARGDDVLVIDNLSTGRRDHLPKTHPKLTFIEDTIADKSLVEKLVGDFKPDVLIHTALCYGVNPSEHPITLNHPKNPANSSYAISKTTTEDYLEISGQDYVTFRLANVIGPRNVSGPLPIFYQRLTQGKSCFVTEARRDFVFVKDLAKYVVTAADGTGLGAYHFSSGKDVAIKDLYDAVVKAMGLQEYPEPEIRPLSPDDAPTILLDPSRTFKDFGDIEFTPLDELVAEGIAYFKAFGVHGGYTHLKHNKSDE